MALKQANSFWVRGEGQEWFSAQIVSVVDNIFTLRYDDGHIEQVSSKSSQILPRNPENVEDSDDLVVLPNLDEPNIYTFTGQVLMAVNPWTPLDLYSSTILDSYSPNFYDNLAERGIPPHSFAVALRAYVDMSRSHKNQVVLISGESGAGKTETTKHVVRYLAYAGGGRDPMKNLGAASIEHQVLESNPLLEAFGNAKTLRNENSSRFGKFFDVHFDAVARICGSSVTTYLLEKSRVVEQSKGERNYHIFYQLCAGAKQADDNLYRFLRLADATEFEFLRKGECLSVASIPDVAHFKRTTRAMEYVGITPALQRDIFRVLAAVLHLGNASFGEDKDGNATLPSSPSVANVVALLDVTVEQLRMGLCSRKVRAGKEEYITNQTLPQAQSSLSALAKALYANSFRDLVARVNKCLRMDKPALRIGVLDIFGFERFAVNRFEQFCINYANEKLQFHFYQFNIVQEQSEYQREGIPWTELEAKDNGGCLSMIESKPNGILLILDEICIVPKGSDELFQSTLGEKLSKAPHFVAPKLRNQGWTVRHYAGDVMYTSDGFLEKNRDALQPDLVTLMTSSGNAYVKSLFEATIPPTPVDGSKMTRQRSSSIIFESVTSQFRAQLRHLMDAIESSTPHFIRCINPNSQMAAGSFVNGYVAEQLRNSGVLSALEVARSGYPSRFPIGEFNFKFACLFDVAFDKSLTAAQLCLSILKDCNVASSLYAIGRTKVFMKRQVIDKLEERRSKRLRVYVEALQRGWRCHLARSKASHRRMRRAACLLQMLVRSRLVRLRYAAKVVEVRKRKELAEREAAKRRKFASMMIKVVARRAVTRRSYGRMLDLFRVAKAREVAMAAMPAPTPGPAVAPAILTPEAPTAQPPEASDGLGQAEMAAAAAGTPAVAATGLSEGKPLNPAVGVNAGVSKQSAKRVEDVVMGPAAAAKGSHEDAMPSDEVAKVSDATEPIVSPRRPGLAVATRGPAMEEDVEDVSEGSYAAPLTPSPMCIRIDVALANQSKVVNYINQVEELAKWLKGHLDIKDRTYHFKVHRRCFRACDAWEWLRQHVQFWLKSQGSLKDQLSVEEEELVDKLPKSMATLLCRRLIDAGVIRHVAGSVESEYKDSQALLRFHEDEAKEIGPLNSRKVWLKQARNALVVSVDVLLKALELPLHNPSLRQSPEFREFEVAVGELQRVSLVSLTPSELLAFYLNLYNTMVLHGHVSKRTPPGAHFKASRVVFSKAVTYSIGGYSHTLEDIENYLLGGPCFSKKRKAAREPRVLLAMSWGCEGSPKVRVFTPTNVITELEECGRDFYGRERARDMAPYVSGGKPVTRITLPKLFKWFQNDFGTSRSEAIRFFARFAPEPEQSQLRAVADSHGVKVTYRPFQWAASLPTAFEKVFPAPTMSIENFTVRDSLSKSFLLSTPSKGRAPDMLTVGGAKVSTAVAGATVSSSESTTSYAGTVFSPTLDRRSDKGGGEGKDEPRGAVSAGGVVVRPHTPSLVRERSAPSVLGVVVTAKSQKTTNATGANLAGGTDVVPPVVSAADSWQHAATMRTGSSSSFILPEDGIDENTSL